MPVNNAYTTIVRAGDPYYRITTIGYHTANAKQHKNVVNGQGALANPHGGRYNHPGVVSVYLTETVDTCLAEKMFYFQREIVRSLDALHLPPNLPVPAFVQQFVLWEVVFKNDITDVCDLAIPNAPTFFNVFPCLMNNPSQDYHHLKDRRTHIRHQGYSGIRAPSSRCTNNGNIVVLFADQSNNVQRITPYAADFRLIDTVGVPFVNHFTQWLDFTAGQVQIAGLVAYNSFANVPFNR